MLLNNKKTRATMKLEWEYVIVHMCSGLSEIDMLSNTQNLPADQTDYENSGKCCLNCEFSQWQLLLVLVSGQLGKRHIVTHIDIRVRKILHPALYISKLYINWSDISKRILGIRRVYIEIDTLSHSVVDQTCPTCKTSRSLPPISVWLSGWTMSWDNFDQATTTTLYNKATTIYMCAIELGLMKQN